MPYYCCNEVPGKVAWGKNNMPARTHGIVLIENLAEHRSEAATNTYGEDRGGFLRLMEVATGLRGDNMSERELALSEVMRGKSFNQYRAERIAERIAFIDRVYGTGDELRSLQRLCGSLEIAQRAVKEYNTRYGRSIIVEVRLADDATIQESTRQSAARQAARAAARKAELYIL